MKINTVRLRIILGILSIALPWIVALLNGSVPSSISATYYVAQCITPFMGILIAASVLLISYRGYTKLDDIILTLAGVCGLLICLCPTYTASASFVGTFMLPVDVSYIIHNVSAILFFALLAYNSFFLFTKTNGNMTKKKKARNIIYRICGVGMLASFLILLLPTFYIQIWLTEMFALSFFGISFLTKADVFPFLFCDTSYKEGDD